MRQLSVFLVSFLVCAQVWAKNKIVDKLTLKTGIYTNVVEAEDIKARVMGFNIGLKVKDQFSSTTTLFFDVDANLETGSNESVGNIAEWEPTESLDLNEGGFKFKPFSWASARVGALNQGDYKSPLLIGNTAFAAIEEKLNFGFLYLRAQQAVPSNNQLTKRVGGVDDATPFFGMETLGFKFGKKRTRFIAEFSHFKFKDLSSSTALISKELGNSVEGVGEAAEYNYEFEGLNQTTHFEHLFRNGFKFSLGGQYLYNDKAPEERNRGYLGRVGLGTKNMQVVFEGFRNESDSSPSYYNSKYYGHNNSEGNAVGLVMDGEDFAFNMRYIQAKAIEEDLLKNDMDLVTIKLVKYYEI